MKNTSILFVLIVSLVFGCFDSTEESNHTNQVENKLLLLKVDFTTNTFEGGKEFVFDENTTEFTVTSTYQAPGDFGSIQLYYEPLNELIFDGGIIWMGTGVIEYPNTMLEVSDFQTIEDPVDNPNVSLFTNVMYSEFAYYPEDIDYTTLWNSIANLQVVEEYRLSNPDSEIKLFLYTPSVGAGNPEEWDWFILFKN